MNYIAIVTITLLSVIALIHFYWAFGGKLGIDAALPTKNGKRLLNPTKLLTFLVGFLILGFAFVVYTLAFGKPNEIYIYLGWSISCIFFLRAIGEFNMVGVFKKIKDTKFAEYDTKYFTPLCFYFGVSIGWLSFLYSL